MFKSKRRLSNKIAIFLQGYFIFGIPSCCAWYYTNTPLRSLIANRKVMYKYNIHLDYTPCSKCLVRELSARGVI